ncbi:MAG: AbrB/MazE/SpoVT family DNA-binding domain-containing protein [Nitrosotalea sp.]
MSAKGQIVIPTDFRKKLHLKMGDKLLLYSTDNIIVIRKVEPYEPVFAAITKPIRARIRKLAVTRSDVNKAIEDARKSKEKT